MKNNNSLLFIDLSPRLWPMWLTRRVVKPLLSAGYVRFYGNVKAKDAFKLTSLGTVYAATL